MAANNMINAAVDPATEDDLFASEVAQVKKWWSDPRWRSTRRPFTAEQIVSKRGNLKIEYPSNAQAKKLWAILEGRFQVCSVSPVPLPVRRTTDDGRAAGPRTMTPATPTAASSPPC